MINPIDEILDEFKFQRVHKAMLALDWKWAPANETPSIEELRAEAKRLLNELVNSKFKELSSGGFTAYMHDGVLGLRFEIWAIEVAEQGIGQ